MSVFVSASELCAWPLLWNVPVQLLTGETLQLGPVPGYPSVLFKQPQNLLMSFVGAILYTQNSHAHCAWLALFSQDQMDERKDCFGFRFAWVGVLERGCNNKILTLNGADPWLGSSYELAWTAQKTVTMQRCFPCFSEIRTIFSYWLQQAVKAPGATPAVKNHCRQAVTEVRGAIQSVYWSN